MKKLLFGLLAAVVSFTSIVDAGSYSSSSSRASSSTSKSYSPSPSPSKVSTPAPKSNAGYGNSSTTPTTTTTPTSSNAGYGNSSSTSTTKTTTNSSAKTPDALKSYNNKTAIAPTKSKAEVVEQFKKDNAAKYQTNFETEPAKRPSYIPTTTTTGGITHTIVYDHRYGGYGYVDALGHFMLYDALSRAADLHYTHTYAAQPGTVVYATEHGFWYYVGMIFFVIILVVLTVVVIALIA